MPNNADDAAARDADLGEQPWRNCLKCKVGAGPPCDSCKGSPGFRNGVTCPACGGRAVRQHYAPVSCKG